MINVLSIRNIDTGKCLFILHSTYISCMQTATLMYFHAINDSASLATLDSGTEVEEDRDKYNI